MNKMDNSLTDKLKMTPKQSEVLNTYKNKVANTKFVINAETYGSVNTLQTKKSFYNRALEIFIESKFGMDNHFGNMTNNFNEVLKHLNIQDILDFKLKVPAITKKAFSIDASKTNNFKNFEANSVFECTLFAKENVDSETFLKAIEVIENDFIIKYNTIAKEEIKVTKLQMIAEKKAKQKKELITYGTIGITLVVAVFLFLKYFK